MAAGKRTTDGAVQEEKSRARHGDVTRPRAHAPSSRVRTYPTTASPRPARAFPGPGPAPRGPGAAWRRPPARPRGRGSPPSPAPQRRRGRATRSETLRAGGAPSPPPGPGPRAPPQAPRSPRSAPSGPPRVGISEPPHPGALSSFSAFPARLGRRACQERQAPLAIPAGGEGAGRVTF